MHTRRTVIGALVATLAIFGASACGDDDDGAGDGDGPFADLPGDFDIDVGDEVPDDFPTGDVPLPDGRVVSAASIGDGTQRGWTLVYEVDDVAAAAESYRDALEGAGFTVEGTFAAEDDEGELASITATGGAYIVTAFAGGVGPPAGESTLSLTVAPVSGPG